MCVCVFFVFFCPKAPRSETIKTELQWCSAVLVALYDMHGYSRFYSDPETTGVLTYLITRISVCAFLDDTYCLGIVRLSLSGFNYNYGVLHFIRQTHKVKVSSLAEYKGHCQ